MIIQYFVHCYVNSIHYMKSIYTQCNVVKTVVPHTTDRTNGKRQTILNAFFINIWQSSWRKSSTMILLQLYTFDFYKWRDFSSLEYSLREFVLFCSAWTMFIEIPLFEPLLCVYQPTLFCTLVWICFGFTWFRRIATNRKSHLLYSIEKCCLATEVTLRLHFYAMFYDIIAVMWDLNETSERFMDQLYFGTP